MNVNICIECFWKRVAILTSPFQPLQFTDQSTLKVLPALESLPIKLTTDVSLLQHGDRL